MALMNSRPRSERSLRGIPKYGINMPHQGLANGVSGMVAGWDEAPA